MEYSPPSQSAYERISESVAVHFSSTGSITKMSADAGPVFHVLSLFHEKSEQQFQFSAGHLCEQALLNCPGGLYPYRSLAECKIILGALPRTCEKNLGHSGKSLCGEDEQAISVGTRNSWLV